MNRRVGHFVRCLCEGDVKVTSTAFNLFIAHIVSDRRRRFCIIDDDICDWAILGLIHAQGRVTKCGVLGAWNETVWADELMLVVHADAHSIDIRCIRASAGSAKDILHACIHLVLSHWRVGFVS